MAYRTHASLSTGDLADGLAASAVRHAFAPYLNGSATAERGVPIVDLDRVPLQEMRRFAIRFGSTADDGRQPYAIAQEDWRGKENHVVYAAWQAACARARRALEEERRQPRFRFDDGLRGA